MEWFYAKNNQQIGPVTLEQLNALIASGEVSRADMVWREGMSDWVPAGEVPELVAAIRTPPPALPGNTTPGYTPGWVPPPPIRAAQVENYLLPAILVTLFCCQIFGIIAIVYAAQVDGKLARGDYDGAVECSKNAKMWSIIAACSIVIPIAVGIILAFSGR